MTTLSRLLLVLIALGPVAALGNMFQHGASFKEYDQVFTTYPYSDPDPLPEMSRFYPYFRYDGFTATPTQQKWKVVELSNDYLKLLILPQIGGKIWAAIEKTTGNSFIYFNHVIKFRDVSMRGPWTSGGMEANYGIMGHTPNCFSPVDYLVRRNPDGSVSCFIGTLDLLTRSTWRLEINLPAEEACFTTRSLWHNGSKLSEPYYSWMNVGIKAAGNLEFISPGTHYIGHDGSAAPWPLDPQNGHNLAWYDQNNFGSYKSYHVIGRAAEFFGGYWHNDDFGMAHFSSYGDKPGRKIWIWGLSGEGMIWEKLLTDHDGQYVELQSGRLFNQAADSSSRTPFKHMEFAPYATDTWKEYWFPVKGTQGFVSASPWGALNVTQARGRLFVRICPVRYLNDYLQVFDGDHRLFSKKVHLRPMLPIEEEIPLSAPARQIKVTLGGDRLEYAPAQDQAISRPMEAPANFDWNSLYGRFLQGKESARQRAYGRAAEEFQRCLTLDSNYAPALVEMADLANRRADWSRAREFALRALRVDTYDAGANYQLGLASAGLGRALDAREALSIAALSPAWRSAASLELAKAFLREGHYDRALECARQSLAFDARNLDALELEACVCRLEGDQSGARGVLRTLLGMDPLNHLAWAEKYLNGTARAGDFTGLIRHELPQETYLEIATFYHSVGRDGDAAKILSLSPPTAEVRYWLAYLTDDTKELARANAASPAFVLPFRPESIAPFKWAASHSTAWQPNYYLALIHWYQGELHQAQVCLEECGDKPLFSPFYAVRAQLNETNRVADLQKAARLDPGQWRFGALLTRCYLEKEEAVAALAVAAKYASRFPANSTLALLHAKALMLNHDYRAAADLLDSLDLLPCEGSTEAHSLFREANLMLALERMNAEALTQAQALVQKAREWPDHLGAGKPYPENVDERLEDWLSYQCALDNKEPDAAQQALRHLLAWGPPQGTRSAGDVVRALALKSSGQAAEAERLLKDWMKAQSENELPKWGLQLLDDQSGQLPLKQQNCTSRVLEAWFEQFQHRSVRKVESPRRAGAMPSQLGMIKK